MNTGVAYGIKTYGRWGNAVFLRTVLPNLTAVDASRPVWPSCPAYGWATGVDAGGLPNGEAFAVPEIAAFRAKNVHAVPLADAQL